MTMHDESFLDGNVAGGELSDIFVGDVTGAIGQCGGCGESAALAQMHAYVSAPGLVLRCACCQSVLMRVVRGPTCAWLDVRGLTHLRLSLTQA
jgi:hypothetical protein